MHSTKLAQQAYAPASAATHTPRDVEYHAFAYVTGLLAGAKDQNGEPGGVAKLAEALNENVKLWITLAADCADDGNKLPPQTRGQIIGLANFARNHMHKVLTGGAEIDPLIEVNLSIMKGLRNGASEESGVK
jgi:flagellar protein FlaF